MQMPAAPSFPLASPPTGPRLEPRRLLTAAWGSNRPLTLVAAIMLLSFGAMLVGLVVDPRVITGAPAWLKLAKFAVSIAIYCFTLVWLLGFVQGRPRLVGLIAWGTALALIGEEIIIAGQALRGTTSHFNETTAFDTALWQTMGAMISGVWLLGLLTAVLLIRQRLPDPAFGWGLRLGVLASLVGMATAFAMATGDAHSVGVADGGAGLPILGWSTEGGDLRAAHFVGLHGLQFLPLVGWLLSRPGMARLGDERRVALVWVAGLLYLGVVLLLFWQALRGESVAAPGGTTLAALGLLLGVAAVAAVALVATRWWAPGTPSRA